MLIDILDGQLAFVMKNNKRVYYACFELPTDTTFTQYRMGFTFSLTDTTKLNTLYNYYRPQISGEIYRRILRKGEIAYFSGSKNDNSAKKYGKRMNRMYLGEVPAQVNVYNKKPDIDIDSVKITNASSNVTIQNHQHSIIGFIECANVGVSIEQIPTEQIK